MTKRRLSWIAIAVVFIAGILFTVSFHGALEFTNELEFCTSCHSMQVNLREYKKTIHYKNALGIRAVCSDCHVPKEFFPKMKAKILAYKDVLGEITGVIDTKKKYEAHRWEMANIVWAKMRADHSRECKNCHKWNQMDLSAQSRRARKRHGEAIDKGKECIDCHSGIAHEDPEEPDDDDDS